MLRTVSSFGLRAVTLIAVSLALGSGVADRAAAQAAVQTRVASCAGFDFHPINSRTTYQWFDRVLFRDTDQGDGWFMCSAHLPHRAVVKQVRFTVQDFASVINVRYCALIRTSLKLTGGVQALAVMSSTGLDAAPGVVRLSDTSIAFATVDNANYAYSLQCQILYFKEGFTVTHDPYGGRIGADVTYSISAANG